jgi:hypothetical protein
LIEREREREREENVGEIEEDSLEKNKTYVK